MQNEVLEKIKKDYQELKSHNDTNKSKKNRMTELERNVAVQEYINLINYFNIHREKILSDEEVAYRVYLKNLTSIKESNQIYVYLGTFVSSSETDIEHGPKQLRVKRDDPIAEYSVYKDIETEEVEEVLIANREQFESTHKVVYTKDYDENREFYNIQRDFILDCINNDQSYAVERVLSRTKKKNTNK